MKLTGFLKKSIPCAIFCLIFALALSWLTDVLTPKATNRYYILERYLEDHPEDYLHDVQVFGSCHSYTSFNPVYLERRTGISAFVYGNAGEIIPTTYVRMAEQFKKHTPKVALVEIWGINPYETYDSRSRIFGFYLANNLERTGFSLAKQEVIGDFDALSFEGDEYAYDDVSYIKMNFPIVNYKERFFDGSLTDVDLSYSFEKTQPYSTEYTFSEMTSRLSLNGYKKNPSKWVLDYPEKQNVIEEGDFLEIEPDIVKYIRKIIDLCKENDVALIFYRSPYLARVNELRKLNHMRQLCQENGVLFLDLEQELSYSYYSDFLDTEHLSEAGADRSTEFLIPYILQAMEGSGISNTYTGGTLPDDLLENGDFTDPVNSRGQTSYTGADYTIDAWRTNFSGDTVELAAEGLKNTCHSTMQGWHLHQSLDDTSSLVGGAVTAVFHIVGHSGESIRPVISCRDANDEEIRTASAALADGLVTVTCPVPEGTEYIRVGFYGYDGAADGDFIAISSVSLYEGAYTAETLPAA